MTTNSETDETEESIEETGWRGGEFSGSGGIEKQYRESTDEELHETMDKAFNEPIPRARDPVAFRKELVEEGDASAAKALLDGDEDEDEDDLEKRLEDATPEELMKTLAREVQANRKALERLAGDEGEKDSPWTL